MQDRLSKSIAPQLFNALALGVFASFALLLATIGIYLRRRSFRRGTAYPRNEHPNGRRRSVCRYTVPGSEGGTHVGLARRRYRSGRRARHEPDHRQHALRHWRHRLRGKQFWPDSLMWPRVMVRCWEMRPGNPRDAAGIVSVNDGS